VEREWRSAGDVRARSIEVGLAGAGHLLNFSFLVIVSAMLLIVAVDVPFQIWQYHDKLKMTQGSQEGRQGTGRQPRSQGAHSPAAARGGAQADDVARCRRPT
jgi:flagellar biosynthesis protein FlhB